MTTTEPGRDVHTAELRREQEQVDVLYARLDLLRERASDALDAVRRARDTGTPQGRLERDAFDTLHSERLRRLRAVEDRLAFGRLDLAEEGPRYVGRIGLLDDDQSPLLVDWRAPAASAFYQATAARPAGVVRRRHLGTRGRQVVSLDDDVLDADAMDSADLATVEGEGALMLALGARRTGRMRDIVATMQAEQDEVVRAGLPGVLVVQGGPGTGKTAVALHRAAYLLYTHRDRIARSGVLVVGPSPVFLRYIEQVLPSLGETGVVMATPGRLFPGVDARAGEDDAVAAVKGDGRMAEVVRAAVRARQKRLAEPVEIRLDGDRVVLRPETVAAARGRARAGGQPHNEGRNTFAQSLLDDLARQLARVRGLDGRDGTAQWEEDDRHALLTELRDSKHVRREINLLWMPLTATGLVAGLVGSPGRLRAGAEGILTHAEQRLLLRDDPTAWTAADVPLLDEAAELIGEDVTRGSQAQDVEVRRLRAESVAHARDVLEQTETSPSMVSAEALADRFAASADDMALADRAAGDRSWSYGHVVVDEAQELSAMAWRLLARRCPTMSFTVVGDTAQTGSAAGTTDWKQVLDPLAPGRWVLRELTVNYRTPEQVMDLATALLRAHGVAVTPPSSARRGDDDPELVSVPRDPAGLGAAVRRAASSELERLGAGDVGRVAVIAPDAVARSLGEVSDDQRAGVLTVSQAKGLEFDAVVVVDPAGMVATGPRGVNDLYVALTRPTQRLVVLHHDDLPPGM